jgi:hypothetical protein
MIDPEGAPNRMATNSKELQAQIEEQEEMIGDALDVLQEAYTPKASRADLVDAVSNAIDILSGEGETAEEDEDDNEGE